MDYDILVGKLLNLPDEANKNHSFEVRKILLELQDISVLQKVVEDNLVQEKVRFNAFYSLLVLLWRNRDYIDYRILVDTFEDTFKQYKLFNTFKSQYYLSQGSTIPHLESALEYAKKAKDDLSDLPNVRHLYCYILAELYENSEFVNRKKLLEALREIEKCIILTDGKYLKYSVTKARLLSLLDRFSEAKELIRIAIENEASSSKDYAIRLAEYQETRIRVLHQQYSRNFKERQESAIKELEDIKMKVVELLGLLAAVLAFLLASVQIATRMEYNDAARLLTTSGGIIILIFSSFSIIFFRSGKVWRKISVILFGLIIIVLSYYFM